MEKNTPGRVQKYVQAIKGMQFLIGFVIGLSLMFLGGKSFLSWSTETPIISFDGIELIEIKGDSLKFSELNRSHRFVYFWASWHKRSIKDAPQVTALCKELVAKNCSCLFISDESPKIIEQLQVNSAKQIRFFHSPKRLREVGLKGLPTYYLLDPNGQILSSKTGIGHWDSQENREMLFLKISGEQK